MDTLASNVFDCALCFEGGGYRDSFTSGVVDVLLEEGIYFDYVCGISAGSSSTVNYLSRDRSRVHNSFVLDEKTHGAVGVRPLLRGKGWFDADFLYEQAPHNGALPFDWETFSANPARCCIQSFERDSGRTLRFHKDEMTNVDRMMDLVRASSTLPGAMKPLPVDGRVCLDGGLGIGAGIPVPMAEADGFERVFFVATRPAGYRKKAPEGAERKIYLRLSRNYPYLRKALLTRWERYNAALDHVDELEAAGRAIVVRPEHMDVGSGTTDSAKQQAMFDLGRAQALRDLPRWREFLGL